MTEKGTKIQRLPSKKKEKQTKQKEQWTKNVDMQY